MFNSDILSNIPGMPALPENLGDLTAGFSLENLLASAGAFAKDLFAKLVAMIPESVFAIYNAHKVIFLLLLVCVLGLVAFEGYRFFKMLAYAGSAFLFGVVGYWYLAPALESTLRPMIPEILDYHATVAIGCAIVAVLLCTYAFNLVMFGIGAVAGYAFGNAFVYGYIVNQFNTLTFLQNDDVKKVVSLMVAVIAAFFFVWAIKLVFMFATSFGGMVGGALLLQQILVPGADQQVQFTFVIIGIALAIFSLIRQRNIENNSIFNF